MKWFKHLVDSGDDPDIDDAMSLFGSDGYYVFFRTLEVMSREFDIKKPGECTFSCRYFRKKFTVSWAKVIKILEYFMSKDRIVFSISNDNKLGSIELYCDKLKGLSDEYTSKRIKKKSGASRDVVGTVSGLSSEQESESESESESEVEVDLSINQGIFLDEIKESISKIKKLPEKSSAFNPHAWVQVQINESMHPQAIAETLGGLIKYWGRITKSPWEYANKAIKTKSQNYHEQDHIEQSENFKHIWIGDPEVEKIVKGLFK